MSKKADNDNFFIFYMSIIIIISTLMALILAPLGCLVLWKRYVYFSDGLAHASMLATAISSLLNIPIIYAGVLNTLLFAAIIFNMRNHFDNNAPVGFASSLMVASALLLSWLFPGQFNLNNLLFGNIITADYNDVWVLSLILICLLSLFLFFYRDIILTILSREIAVSRGTSVNFLDFIFLSLLSFTVLIMIKIVGALLVTSIILIPAMTARLISKSPVRMILLAIIFAELSNMAGIGLSFYADMPFAPIIIFCSGIIFLIIYLSKNYMIK